MTRILLTALALAVLPPATAWAGGDVEEYEPPPPPPEREIPEEFPHVDMGDIAHVKRLAATGYTFTLVGVGLMIGSWIAYFPDVGKKGGSLSPAWIFLMSAWGGASAIGIPLLLASNYKARRILGYPPVGGHFIAGWFFLCVAYASLAFIDAQPVYTMLYATIGYVVSLTWSMAAAARGLNRLRKYEKVKGEKKAMIIPTVTGLPGGAMIGLAGAF